jgi:hypothetical protein
LGGDVKQYFSPIKIMKPHHDGTFHANGFQVVLIDMQTQKMGVRKVVGWITAN